MALRVLDPDLHVPGGGALVALRVLDRDLHVPGGGALVAPRILLEGKI